MPIIPIIVVLILLGIDQLTKYLAVTHLKPISSLPILDNIFELYYITNDGAAFSILSGQRWFFIITVIIICTVIVIFYAKLPKQPIYKYVKICLVLILSGAVGNLIDRIFRDGMVVDFLRFIPFNFPIFNVADMYVVVGAISFGILVIFFIKDEKSDKTEKNNDDEKAEA